MAAAVRLARSAEQAEEWAVVLAAGGIAHRVEAANAGWVVLVAAADAARASRALAAYDEEERGVEAAPPAPPAEYGRTWIGAAVAAGLVGFFAVTGPRDGSVAWFVRGSASAEAILRGEVWRAVTALTLHADVVHVLGNALACVVLVTAVGWRVGPGIGSWLVLLAGAWGNLLTALAYGAHHVSVGASTATFGAVGILAGGEAVARRRGRPGRRGAWVVIGASLALLGMLGTGAGADLLAHFFGLLVGAALGVAVALALEERPGPRAQWGLALVALAVVVGCWALALRPAVPG